MLYVLCIHIYKTPSASASVERHQQQQQKLHEMKYHACIEKERWCNKIWIFILCAQKQTKRGWPIFVILHNICIYSVHTYIMCTIYNNKICVYYLFLLHIYMYMCTSENISNNIFTVPFQC